MKRVHLGVIAGNEAGVMERFLRSFGPHVDGVAICWAHGAAEADESSAIAKRVCEEIGVPLAQTMYFNTAGHEEWQHVDNFAAARNAAFHLAANMGRPSSLMTPEYDRPEWLMWADCDDVLSPHGAAMLDLLRRKDAQDADVIFAPYYTDAQGSYARRERLVRTSHFLGWQNAVHEVFTFREDARVAWLEGLRIVHSPATNKPGSLARNTRILEGIAPAERSGREWFFLFREYEAARRIPEAMEAAIVATGCADLGDLEKEEAYRVVGRNIAKAEDAERPLLESVRLFPGRREGYAELVNLHLARGDRRKALEWARVMQAVPVPQEVAWNHNAALYGWKGDDLLWRAMSVNGERDEALRQRARALRKSGIRISVAHPTCRGKKARIVREMWLDRARRPDCIEYVFGVNAGDAEVMDELHDLPYARSPRVSPGFSSAVANYNEAVAATSGPIVICAQDDVYPPHGWDDLVFDALRPFLQVPRVLHVFDGFRKDWLMVVQCVTRPWLRKHGTLFSAEYDGYWSDTEFSFRAYQAGEVVDGRHIAFYHDHPAFTGAACDAEYMRQQNPAAEQRGRETFQRRNPGFAGWVWTTKGAKSTKEGGAM